MPVEKLVCEWFVIDKWEGSSAVLLPMEARGLYREMMTAAWRRGAKLPKDPEKIKRAVRCTSEEWDRCWPQVAPYWRVAGEWLVNDTQLAVYAESKAKADAAHDKAMKAAAASPQVKRKVEREEKLKVELEVTPPSPSPSVSQSLERDETAFSPDPVEPIPEHLRSEYSDAVWNDFVSRVGQPTRLMSEPEFQVVKSWMDAGIPLRVVLSAFSDTKKPGRILGYYKRPVQIAYERWRRNVQVWQ